MDANSATNNSFASFSSASAACWQSNHVGSSALCSSISCRFVFSWLSSVRPQRKSSIRECAQVDGRAVVSIVTGRQGPCGKWRRRCRVAVEHRLERDGRTGCAAVADDAMSGCSACRNSGERDVALPYAHFQNANRRRRNEAAICPFGVGPMSPVNTNDTPP